MVSHHAQRPERPLTSHRSKLALARTVKNAEEAVYLEKSRLRQYLPEHPLIPEHHFYAHATPHITTRHDYFAIIN
jgi:hypothetical protein